VTEKLNDTFDPLTHQTGLFRFQQESSAEQVDISAILRVWKNVENNDDGSSRLVLNVEISWPAEKPYDAREKEIFNTGIFKPAKISITSIIDDTVIEYENKGYTVRFDCDFVEVKSSKKKIRQVKFWYQDAEDWEPESINVNIGNSFTLIQADIGRKIEKVKLTRSINDKRWTEFVSDVTCSESDELGLNSVVGIDHEKNDCTVRFDCDYITVKNDRNWPIRQVVFWYDDENDWESESNRLFIGDEISTVKADPGKKIKQVALSRYTNNWGWITFESDAICSK
jgi:hypothetical protein